MEEKIENFELSEAQNARQTLYFAKRKNIPGVENQEFAVKKIDLSIDEMGLIEEIKNTMNSYKFIKSPFILKPQYYSLTKAPGGGVSVFLFYDRMKMSLEDLCNDKRRKGIFFTAEEMKALVKSVMSGFEMLQSKKFLHRNIKPSNILLSFNDQWKISEAGFPSGNLQDSAPQELQAPEMSLINKSAYSSQRFDYWRTEAYSVGIILLVAATLRRSEDLNDLKKLGGIPAMQYLEKLMTEVSSRYGDYLWKILSGLTELEQSKRADFLEINADLILYQNSRDPAPGSSGQNFNSYQNEQPRGATKFTLGSPIERNITEALFQQILLEVRNSGKSLDQWLQACNYNKFMKMISKNDFLTFLYKLNVNVDDNQLNCLQKVVGTPSNTYDISVLIDMDAHSGHGPASVPGGEAGLKNVYDRMPQHEGAKHEGLNFLLKEIKDFCLKSSEIKKKK